MLTSRVLPSTTSTLGVTLTKTAIRCLVWFLSSWGYIVDLKPIPLLFPAPCTSPGPVCPLSFTCHLCHTQTCPPAKTCGA